MTLRIDDRGRAVAAAAIAGSLNNHDYAAILPQLSDPLRELVERLRHADNRWALHRFGKGAHR